MSTATIRSARNKTVLLVEDDHDVRVALRNLLEDEGYDVLTAGDGHNAFELLEHGGQLPDIIVVDLMMPVMDGWTLVEALKRAPRYAQIPVIIQSAFRHPPPPASAATFLGKPVDEEALLRAIRRHLVEPVSA